MTQPTMLRQPLWALPLTFFDFETTGLAPTQGHRVCEVGLRRVRGARIEMEYTTLVDPQRPVDPGAFAVNGISAEMLQGAPCFAQIADAVLAVMGSSVLVAHNAPFDVAFLTKELELLGRPAPLNPVLDTLVLARRLLRCRSYSLRALAEELGLESPQHRAMQDVDVLAKLFRHLQDKMAEQQITTLEAVLRLQRGLLPGQPEPEPPGLIAVALREGRRLRIVYHSRTTPGPTERVVRPIELLQESKGVYMRAFCYLRNDVRVFALEKIQEMELA